MSEAASQESQPQERKRRIEELQRRIADLERRWPAHSVPAAMLQQLDELEEELERARADEGQ